MTPQANPPCHSGPPVRESDFALPRKSHNVFVGIRQSYRFWSCRIVLNRSRGLVVICSIETRSLGGDRPLQEDRYQTTKHVKHRLPVALGGDTAAASPADERWRCFIDFRERRRGSPPIKWYTATLLRALRRMSEGSSKCSSLHMRSSALFPILMAVRCIYVDFTTVLRGMLRQGRGRRRRDAPFAPTMRRTVAHTKTREGDHGTDTSTKIIPHTKIEEEAVCL